MCLFDLLRATIEVNDPYLVAVAARLLRAVFGDAVRVKNKFADAIDTSSNAGAKIVIPVLHMNFDLDGHIVEVQIILSDHLTIKKEAHKYYEIARAVNGSSVSPILVTPVFKLK